MVRASPWWGPILGRAWFIVGAGAAGVTTFILLMVFICEVPLEMLVDVRGHFLYVLYKIIHLIDWLID